MRFVLGSKVPAVPVSHVAGLLAASLVSCLLFVLARHSVDDDAMERFAHHAGYAQSQLGARVKSYNDLLNAARSHLEAGDQLSAHLFHTYVAGLDLPRRYPAVDAINMAFAVTDRERDAFLQKISGELTLVSGRAVKVDVSPPGRRDNYLITSYIEPLLTSRADRYGVDLLSAALPKRFLENARDEGSFHSSGVPIAILSRPNDTHLGLRVPIYRNGAPRSSVAERRAAYLGSLGIAFSVPRLVQGVMDEMPLAGLRMTVVDRGPYYGSSPDGARLIPGRSRILFDSSAVAHSTTPAPGQDPDVLQVKLPLEFNGRPWETTYSVNKTALYSETDRTYPTMVMVFGFLGSLMIYAIIHVLASSRGAALALAREMTSELRDSQRRLELSHQKLRQLADHAYQVKELERRRIAREIHDDLGQNLLVLRLDTEMLVNRTRESHAKLHQRAALTLEQIDRTIKSVRQIISDLRPSVLDLGLSAAVEWLVNQFKEQSGIACELVDAHEDMAITEHCATAVFRILQESLTNVQRHAGATSVLVELQHAGGWITLMVQDNGRGLPAEGRLKKGSFGLVGIEERVLLLGGTFDIVSVEGGGTTVTVTAPAKAQPSGLTQHHRDSEAGSPVV